MKHYLKEWRLHRGLTQVQLAERMGCSRTQLTGTERGDKRYHQDFLEKAAEVLGTTPADILDTPPGTQTRIAALLNSLTEEERARVQAAILALIPSESHK